MALQNRPDKPDKPSEGQPQPDKQKSRKTLNRIGTALAVIAAINTSNMALKHSGQTIKVGTLKEAVAEQVIDKKFLEEDLGDLIEVRAKINKPTTPERVTVLQSQADDLKRLVDLDQKILEDTNSEIANLKADIGFYPYEMLLPSLLEIALLLGSAKSFSDAKKEEFLNRRRAIIDSNPSPRELTYIQRLDIIFKEETGKSPEESENF
jgi:hypothetical protein